MTMGGNIRWRTRGGTKDIPISRNAQINDVPSTIPYASGHAARVPSVKQ